jgi:hypothetical protein
MISSRWTEADYLLQILGVKVSKRNFGGTRWRDVGFLRFERG